MKRTYPHHPWRRVITSVISAVAVVGMALLLSADGYTQGTQSPTAQHQAIQNQITTHDSNQTSQHTDLSQKIDNVSKGLPPTWDKTLPADDTGDPCNSSRFTCVMGGFAVRDNETGLVWEKSSATTFVTWSEAVFECTNNTTGGRKGWRLPSVHELATLVDPSISAPGPALPAGHPFVSVQLGYYWSATTVADNSTLAWEVSFGGAGIGFTGKTPKTTTSYIKCVRGPMNADQY